MKIGILTTFRRMPDSYSLVHDVKDQIKTLEKHNHQVVFFAQEGCKGEGIDCEMRTIVPHFKLKKNEVNPEMKDLMIKRFKKHFKDLDIVITHDLMYLRSYVTHKEAIMNCGADVKWIHWAHSGVGEMLKIKMPHAKYVTMNYKSKQRFAHHCGVDINDVRVVFNDKDPRLFFKWNPITWKIADKVDLFHRDIMQTYPMCSTRMNAKGIDQVIRIFGELKKLENKVLLIIPNSNARRRQEEIKGKLELAKRQGLDDDEIIFTSQLNPEWIGQVPRDVVKDLMQLSNVFIFPSRSEVCSNVVLEASMTKQLLVLNKDFEPLFDFGQEGKTVLGYHFGSLTQPSFVNENENGYTYVAKMINEHLQHSKSNLQFRRILEDCNIDTIYKKQLEPLLYEKY